MQELWYGPILSCSLIWYHCFQHLPPLHYKDMLTTIPWHILAMWCICYKSIKYVVVFEFVHVKRWVCIIEIVFVVGKIIFVTGLTINKQNVPYIKYMTSTYSMGNRICHKQFDNKQSDNYVLRFPPHRNGMMN